MGKVAKPKLNSTRVGTKVRKESCVKKCVSTVSQKRMLLLRRRLSHLLDEKESWEAKNQDLIDSLNKEKKLTSELQKDVFKCQRLYHEAIISLNTYKVKLADVMQNLSSCVKDINSTYPHIVGLSEVISRNKTKLTSQLNSLRALDTENYAPMTFIDTQQTNQDFSKKSDKRMKHKVGPMVKGVLIQKPTIRLERVMLQQPQGQESANNELSPTGPNALSPITEENEQDTNLHLGQISIRRRRKHRLGSADRWRMRKKEQLEKERKMERERENQRRSVVEESSDSDDQLVGPVIRLQRVSGLLLSPKLLEVDRGRTNEGKSATSRPSEPETHRLRPNDDPMEGCSWMNIHSNSIHSKNKKDPENGKHQSPVTSDSSDEESETLNVSQQKARNSLTDSLYNSKTFTVRRKNSSCSSTADTSQEASDSSKAEPDSTNNIDEVVCERVSSTGDSLGTNSSFSSVVSARKQLGYSDTTSGVNRTPHERESVVNSQTTSNLIPSVGTDAARPSYEQKRSSFCNNCSLLSSPEVQGKRIRKPKVHTYPGEESDNPKTAKVTEQHKRKSAMMSKKKAPNSQLSAGRTSVGKSSTKKCVELVGASSSVQSLTAAGPRVSLGKPSGPSVMKKLAKRSSIKKSIEIPKNSTTTDHCPDPIKGRQSGPSQVKISAKKSSVKKSFEISRNSSQGQVTEDTGGRPSRRNKAPVSYKESPLNVKMRRLN